MSLFQGRFKNQKRKKLKHEFIQASYFQGIEKQFEYGFENQLPTFVLHLIHLLGENQILDHCFAIWNTQEHNGLGRCVARERSCSSLWIDLLKVTILKRKLVYFFQPFVCMLTHQLPWDSHCSLRFRCLC
ncbi:uncharacterized protein LOC111884673 isoform X1 [Lactuca sativa]|uniref:uncharacterized protein LOC111884673 isoform X1 n=1 Tax=Lactuca sativa TaxID=4236 RepID=UPI000CD92625|nr:uncharacterized protein LOC111884673 isoform X1 [Lactuca sativa]XP_042752446.1 uncharacterized protein LOC111884673 isoform X1 [Lactuca sativa]